MFHNLIKNGLFFINNKIVRIFERSLLYLNQKGKPYIYYAKREA